MNLRLPLAMSLVLFAAMVAISVWGWFVLPDGVRLATHWGIDGQVNGTMSKETGLVTGPAIALGLLLLLLLVPRIEPRRENLIASRKAFFAFWIGGLTVLALIHALVVFNAAGIVTDVPGAVMIAVPVMIGVGGNYLGKVRPNFFLGVRTPWTLSSDLSWEKSHRVMARLFVFSALAALATRFAIGTTAAGVVLAATLTASALIGIASSYVYWKHDPERRTT
ncbi:MAG TPA: SdpI family protein [Rhizomicrobium sp.]|nr:SdpI family protein [Rhizomicrobium sp.]